MQKAHESNSCGTYFGTSEECKRLINEIRVAPNSAVGLVSNVERNRVAPISDDQPQHPSFDLVIMSLEAETKMFALG